MKPPSDYLRVVTEGASALRAVGRALRNAAVQSSDAPELWLSVRDVEGLADRLVALPDAEWRTGAATLLITGQDVGVLEELVSSSAVHTTRDASTTKLARLHAFLKRYCDGDFELGERKAHER